MKEKLGVLPYGVVLAVAACALSACTNETGEPIGPAVTETAQVHPEEYPSPALPRVLTFLQAG